jgi:general L-amino acid transport system permease protein
MIGRAALRGGRGTALAIVALAAVLAAAAMLGAGLSSSWSLLRFDFLWERAGFQIAESPLQVEASDPVWRVLLAGLANTLVAALAAAALALPIGIVLAVARGAPIRPIAWPATTLVEAVRNTPVLLQLFLWYAVLTQTLPGPRQAIEIPPGILICNRGLFLPWPTASGIEWPRLGGFNITGGLSLSPELTVLVGGLALFHGCYLAEVFRAGIRAVPLGQWNAARALAYGPWLTFRRIVLPQALGFATPSIAVQILALLKNTSLAVAIGFPDFVGTLATVVHRNGRALEGLLITAIVFLSVNVILGLVVERIAPKAAGRLSVEPRAAAEPRRWTVAEIAISLLVAALLARWVWAALRWGIVDAVWSGPPGACAGAAGACWAVVAEKARLLLVGLYPVGETWRPVLAALLVPAMLPILWLGRGRPAVVFGAAAIGLLAPLWLLGGGFGLPAVRSDLWGGLSLTVFLSAMVAGTASLAALGLAVARMSASPGLAWPARIVIEVFRAVPLVTILLAADLLLPQLSPAASDVPKLFRAFVAVAILATVNLAEVLRGAIRSVPAGQWAAARALGLSGPAAFLGVILPQAIRIATPAAVNVYVGAIKDTSLVVIVGIFDLTGAAKAAVADPSWMRYATEIYLVLAATYFSLCYPIARFARRLERQADSASPARKRSMSAASL